MSIWNELTHKLLHTNQAHSRIIIINVAVFVLIALLKVAAFLFQSADGVNLLVKELTLPASFGTLLYRPWSLLTYMFLHTGLIHLLLNMLWLYWMGAILQEYLGNKHVYLAYFLGGLSGGLLFMFAYQVFPVFQGVKHEAYALGASAGVLSIVVAVATLLPTYQVQLMFIGYVKLKWLALALVVIDLISISSGNPGGHIAHLGGALTGWLFIKQSKNYTFMDKIWRMFDKKSPLKIYHKSASAVSSDEIDVILDKISKSGYDSLTKSEKDKLYKASK